MSAKHLDDWLDPYYIQVSKQEAARIIGRSPTELDRLRKSDPDCPPGFKTGPDRFAKVMFRLSEVYAYSDLLIARCKASNEQ